MIVDSRQLFQKLLRDFSTGTIRAEKEAILLWLLENKLGLSRTEIMAGTSITVDGSSFDGFIDRLNHHEPLQYILEETEFFGRTFSVDQSVLIPRPETELLIKDILNHFEGTGHNVKLLDIGTGSGCIAITLALELPPARIFATDISSDALATAAENAKRLGAHVHFTLQNILTDRISEIQLDAVVSNPPYVMESEKADMEKNVVMYEPSVALFIPDSNPLLFHKAIAEKARYSLKSGGLLLTEINALLGKETAAMFESMGYGNVKIIKDLEGKERFVRGFSIVN